MKEITTKNKVIAAGLITLLTGAGLSSIYASDLMSDEERFLSQLKFDSKENSEAFHNEGLDVSSGEVSESSEGSSESHNEGTTDESNEASHNEGLDRFGNKRS